MKKILLVTIFILSIFDFSNAKVQENDSLKADSKLSSQKTSVIQNQESKIDSEVYYKLMYENAKESNSKLLALLTTALTVIIAVIVAIIGSSFFYNYRFNKKEFELLTKENSNRIGAVQKDLMKETKIKIDEITENNKEKISEEFIQISETYKTNFDTLKDSLKTIITSFKQDVDKNIINHDKAIESIVETIDEIENKAKEDLKLNEKSLKIDILDIKAELYYMKKWYSLALSSFIDQANLCVETNNSWKLEYIVGDIIKSMEKTIEGKSTITPSTKLNIEKLLPHIPDYLSDKRKKIKDDSKNIIIEEIKFKNRNFANRLGGRI